MLKTQFGVPRKIELIPAIHHFPRIGHFRRKDGFLVQKCLPVLAAFVAKMDSWLESASHLSAYRQEQGFAIARLPLQASGNDHKPQRHDSGCHRQERIKDTLVRGESVSRWVFVRGPQTSASLPDLSRRTLQTRLVTANLLQNGSSSAVRVAFT